MDRSQIVCVVYDPPRADFPYLSVIFIPGKDEPTVKEFTSAAEAEAFNKYVAAEMAKKVEK